MLMCAAVSAFCTAVCAFWPAVVADGVPQVAQIGATAARAPARVAWARVPYMRKACPNQKIPIKNMNSNGMTTAVSATSLARVPNTKLRQVFPAAPFSAELCFAVVGIYPNAAIALSTLWQPRIESSTLLMLLHTGL